MWFWVVALSLLLFIVFEESLYYLWNRYVYGRKELKSKYWKNTITIGRSFILRKRIKDAQDKQNHKISS